MLVGRDHEQGRLAELLDAVGDGQSATVQIAGEPGIGKSRLLAVLCDQAVARGHLVLRGRAYESERELPFGVFGAALDDHLAGLPPERMAALAGRGGGALAMVLPGFEPLARGALPPLREERYRAYRAVRALLADLAAEATVVVALDDVQWADRGSVELLSHLLRHPPRAPVCLALAFRPAQVPRQLAVVLAASRREDRVSFLDLQPLAAAEARELAGGDLPDRTRERVCRESGGNPFYLSELAKAARAAGGQPEPGAGTENVPDAVRAALDAELSCLSTPARVLLQGAAVAGDPFEAGLAASAADVGVDEAIDLLDELVARQLVRLTGYPDRFAFRHPIVRATVYQSTGSGWRSRAHARLARVLASRGASASTQAPHVERSARPGEARTVAVLIEAGAVTAASVPALSARWYEAALRLLPESPQDRRHTDLLMARAAALGATGRLEEARIAMCEVLARLPERKAEHASVVAECARVEHLLGRHREADARLSRAHERTADAPAAAALKAELAAGCWYEGRATEMRGWAEQALAAATALGDRPLELVAAGLVVHSAYLLGLPAAAELDRATALLDAIDDAELIRRLDGALWIGWAEGLLERFQSAISHCQRAIDLARSSGQGAFLVGMMTAQAWPLITLGRLARAEELLAGAAEVGRLAPNTFTSAASGMAGRVATYRGDLVGAVRRAEEGVRLGTAVDPGEIRTQSGLHLAAALIEMGAAQRAHDAVLAAAGGEDLPLISRVGRSTAYEVLTRAELLLGRLEAAEGWARRAEADTRGGELAIETATAARAIAAVALARGDADRAAAVSLDGAARADAVGAPVEAARCRILAGRALAAHGRRAAAIAELEGAASALGRVGAGGYRAEAERELRRLGRRVPRRSPAGAPALRSLTERERRVAGLVGRGQTNRAIADALCLSKRTIERDLSRIFEKLGVSSRSALASIIAGADRLNLRGPLEP